MIFTVVSHSTSDRLELGDKIRLHDGQPYRILEITEDGQVTSRRWRWYDTLWSFLTKELTWI